MNPTISLVIPAYNEEKYIKECLEHAIKSAQGCFKEILVIDNASTDDTKKIAESFKEVQVIYEEKKGVTRARERGFREATGDIIAFTDADTLMNQEWFQTVIKEFQSDPNLACLSGPYVFYDTPKWQQIISSLFWNTLAFPTYLVVGHMAVAGNMILRKDVLEKMGGFDTTIEFYGDDTNTARRAKEFGKMKFNPNFTIPSSARRFKEQGIFMTTYLYFINYISEAVFHKQATQEYTDIR